MIQGRNHIGKRYNDMLYQLDPLIKVELKVENGQIFIDPDSKNIKHFLDKVLHTILCVSHQIPRIEKILLPCSTRPYGTVYEFAP